MNHIRPAHESLFNWRRPVSSCVAPRAPAASRGPQAGLELGRCQLQGAVRDLRPAELPVLNPLRHQHDAGAVPEHQLHPVGALGPEHVHRAGERIGAHGLTHQGGEPLPFAEVHRPRRHHNTNRAARTEHDPAFSAPMTAAMMTGEAPFSIVTLTPATSTSMAAARRCRPRRFGRDSGADSSAVRTGSGATTAGTKAGTVSLAFRASRRHVNNCCGVSPWRRATAEHHGAGSERLFQDPSPLVRRPTRAPSRR